MDQDRDVRDTPKKKIDFFNGGRGYDPSIIGDKSTISPPSSPDTTDYLGSRESLTVGSPVNRPYMPGIIFPGITTRDTHLPPSYPTNVSALSVNPYLARNPYATSSSMAYSNTGPFYLQGSHGEPLHFPSLSATEALSQAYGNTALAASRGTKVNFEDSWDLSNEPNDDGNSEPNRESRGRTRQQKCSLCFNHGLIKEKKGHKWECDFTSCQCQRCIITKGRQKTMRDQQKLTRHLQKMQL